MSSPLYNAEILRLAASTARFPRLERADGFAELRAPLCGSRIIVDVATMAGRIESIGMEVRSCALGQASAAILAEQAIGRNSAALHSGLASLRMMLAGEDLDDDSWPGMKALMRAKDYPARHAAILLPFEAAIIAIVNAIDSPYQEDAE
jgi:NifU-like protein involved in Fe-S cluster formation